MELRATEYTSANNLSQVCTALTENHLSTTVFTLHKSVTTKVISCGGIAEILKYCRNTDNNLSLCRTEILYGTS